MALWPRTYRRITSAIPILVIATLIAVLALASRHDPRDIRSAAVGLWPA